MANIILDMIFIGIFHLGAAGAALGTTMSQTFSVMISVPVMMRKKSGIKVTLKDLRPQPAILSNLLKVGIPVALQDGFIQVSFIVITVFANKRGLNDAAAVGIVEKIIGLLFLVPSSMLSTVSVLTAQNAGAGKHDRARKTLWYANVIAVTFGAVVAVIMQFAGEAVVGMFTGSPEVTVLGGQYMHGYVWDCMLAGIHFCFSGYFCAYNMAGISFLHNVVSIICARIPLAYLAAIYFTDTLFPMGIAAPAGSALSVLICTSAYVWMERHQDRVRRFV